MSILNRIALIMALLTATVARGDGISGGIGQGLGGGVSGFDRGISSTGAFTPTPPPTCNGTVDLSTGCAQLVAYGGLF